MWWYNWHLFHSTRCFSRYSHGSALVYAYYVVFCSEFLWNIYRRKIAETLSCNFGLYSLLEFSLELEVFEQFQNHTNSSQWHSKLQLVVNLPRRVQRARL